MLFCILYLKKSYSRLSEIQNCIILQFLVTSVVVMPQVTIYNVNSHENERQTNKLKEYVRNLICSEH